MDRAGNCPSNSSKNDNAGFIGIYFLCMAVWPAWVPVHHVCACAPCVYVPVYHVCAWCLRESA